MAGNTVDGHYEDWIGSNVLAGDNGGWEALRLRETEINYRLLSPAQLEELNTFNNLMAALLSKHVQIDGGFAPYLGMAERQDVHGYTVRHTFMAMSGALEITLTLAPDDTAPGVGPT